MKLNLGSGDTPKRNYLNFDAAIFKRTKSGTRTDVVGRIEAMPFKSNSFYLIFCAHVIEHFPFKGSLELLQICYDLLMVDGLCIIEAPCILGAYEVYVVRQNNIRKYIQMLYGTGPTAVKKYGELAQHKSGWTGPILAEEMKKIGFVIDYVGHGRGHGMGKRDFRVIGRKP